MSGPRARMLYVFDGFRVDPHRRLLFAAGMTDPLRLPPRVFDTLLYLLERPGQVLSKRELLDAVWRDFVVEENSLDQSVSVLRRALGEKPGEHRFIVTVPRRGYRFVATVTSARCDMDPDAYSLYSQA